jgi:hypothetical protein
MDNGIGASEVSAHSYSHLIIQKCTTNTSGAKTTSSTNGTRKTGCPSVDDSERRSLSPTM